MEKISKFLRLIIIALFFPILLSAAQQVDYFGGDDVEAVIAMAEAGDAEAQLALAQRYRFGVDVPQNPATAVEWFMKAADQGNAQGQFSVGYMYATGENGFKNNLETAAEWFRKAAENGHPSAQANLGRMYLYGNGVEINPEAALFWLKKAADQGNTQAQIDLGGRYAVGKSVPKDTERAIDLYNEASDGANAQFSLALKYINGDGVERNPKKAIELYQEAVEQGHIGSMINLANIYAEGKLTRKNLTIAGELLLRAAELGERGAQYNIGLMYYHGKGVKKDRAKAFQWLQKAAKQQFHLAQEDLGRMYLRGEGVTKDEIEGLAWLYLAYENTPVIHPNVQNITNNIASLEKTLRIEKTRLARRRSGEIRHAINLDISARTGAPVPEPAGYPIDSGSGVVISNDGLILTSAHIIAGAESIKIKTALSSNTFTAKILEIDNDNDIAILKHEGLYTPIPVTSSKHIRAGQQLYAVISPLPVENFQGFGYTTITVSRLTGARKDPGYLQVAQSISLIIGPHIAENALRNSRTDSSPSLLNRVSGPVIDESGGFVGMIPRQELSGDMFVSVLRSDVLRPLLEKYGVEIEEYSGNKPGSYWSQNITVPGKPPMMQPMRGTGSIVTILVY